MNKTLLIQTSDFWILSIFVSQEGYIALSTTIHQFNEQISLLSKVI